MDTVRGLQVLEMQARSTEPEAFVDVALGLDGRLRSDLELLLARIDGFEVSASFRQPDPAIEHAARLADPRALLVLALDQLNADTVATLNGLQLRILLLVSRVSTVELARVTSVRSVGILDADTLTSASLQDALTQIAAGEVPLPGPLAHRLLAPQPTTPRLVPRLTPREREVLPLLVAGLSNKQIARRLAISDHGAKRLVGNILAKLDSPNRTCAVTRALREGLYEETLSEQ